MHVLFLFDRLNRFQFRADLVPSFLSINTKKDPHRRTIIMARRILRLGKKALEPSVYGKHQQLQRDTRTNVTKLRARETLDRYGMEALTPQKVNGKWRKPRVSRRKAAVMRKLAMMAAALEASVSRKTVVAGSAESFSASPSSAGSELGSCAIT